MVWIYSASAIKASQNHAAATAFLTRQLLGGAIGIAFMLALSQVDLAPLQDHSRPLQITYGILVLLLVAVLFFGPKINGAHRWIRLGRHEPPALGALQAPVRPHRRGLDGAPPRGLDQPSRCPAQAAGAGRHHVGAPGPHPARA